VEARNNIGDHQQSNSMQQPTQKQTKDRQELHPQKNSTAGAMVAMTDQERSGKCDHGPTIPFSTGRGPRTAAPL
jgi:hypothetical protein